MNDSSVQSLIYVAQVSGGRLRELSDQLATAEPRFVEGILKSLAKEADSLSACLSRLSHYADELPDEATEARKDAPPDDTSLIQLVKRARIGMTHGICETCLGVKTDGGDHGRIEPDPAQPDDSAKLRARQADQEASQ